MEILTSHRIPENENACGKSLYLYGFVYVPPLLVLQAYIIGSSSGIPQF